MNHYLVNWPIDLWAETPEDAARQALDIQRDTKSIATLFDVTDDSGTTIQVDLRDDPEKALRALWDKKGIPQYRQDAIIQEVCNKVTPGAMIGPFKL